MKKNIKDVLNDLQDLLMMKKDLDEEIKKMESQVKEYMTQAHMETLFGEKDQKVTYSEVISNRFNLSQFRKEYGTLYAQFQKPVRSFKFRFTY